MDRHERPDVTAMTRDELKRYGRTGRRQDYIVAAELLRRHRIRMAETRCEWQPDNVVPFRRREPGEGGSA